MFQKRWCGRQTKRPVFVNCLDLIARDGFFNYKLKGKSMCVSSFKFLHQSASHIVRKSFPFLHTAKKYPKVRFCWEGRGRGGEGFFVITAMAALRHGKRGGLKGEKPCWAHYTTQSMFRAIERAFSAQVLPGRETGGWELGVGGGGDRRRLLLLLLWRRRDGTDVHSPPPESIKFAN